MTNKISYKYFDVIVECETGQMPAQRFMSFHSVSRCFGMYVGDPCIKGVFIIGHVKDAARGIPASVELGRWINAAF